MLHVAILTKTLQNGKSQEARGQPPLHEATAKASRASGEPGTPAG